MTYVTKSLLMLEDSLIKNRKKILKIMRKALRRATKIIKCNKELIMTRHDELIEKGVLTGNDLNKYVDSIIVRQSFGRRTFTKYKDYE